MVVLLPDSVRNYLTKFVDDVWMRQHGFLQSDWEVGSISDVLRALPRRPVITADITDRLGDVVDKFMEHGISQIPVLDSGELAGILTESDVLHQLVERRADRNSKVAEVMVRRVSTVSIHASSADLPRIFERGEVAIVSEGSQVVAVLTKMDLIEILANRPGRQLP
jgi:cystathionine beta-synthase